MKLFCWLDIKGYWTIVKSKNYPNTRSVDYFFILSSTLVITTGISSDLWRKARVTASKGDTYGAVNL